MNFPDGLTTKNAQDSLAASICNEIRAGQSARAGLAKRWMTNEKMYRNEPGASGNQIIEGVEPYHIPLVKPKLDRINGVVHHAITGVARYALVVTVNGDRDVADAAERDIQYLLQRANFAKHFWEALTITATTGRGLLRVRYVDGKGFEFKVVHPNDFIVYPAFTESIADAKTSAIRFGMVASEVKEKQRLKEFAKGAVTPGWNPDEDPSGRNPSFDKVDTTETVDVDDALVQLWEFCTKRSLKKDTPPTWFRGIVALDTNLLLSMEPLGAKETAYLEDGEAEDRHVPYEKPWTFGLSYESEYGKFWPSTSLAQHLQGLQQAYSDGFNILFGGSWSAAFPPVVISGGSLGEKVKDYRPGVIINSPTQISAQALPIQFNPNVLPQAMQLLEQVAESVVRIPAMATGQQLQSETTATEANFLAELQRQAEDQYTTYIAVGLKEVFEYVFDLYRIHHEDIKATFGPSINLQDASALNEYGYEVEVNGRASGNSPNVIKEKLQFVLTLAKTFPELGLDPHKIGEQMLNTLELPFNANSIKAPPPNPSGMGGITGQPGMGMGPGIPTGPPGFPPGAVPQLQPGGPTEPPGPGYGP